MKHIKKIALLFICTIIIIPQTGCGNEEPVSESRFLLDTMCAVTVYGMKEEDAKAAIDDAFDCCEKYEDMLSKTVQGSDVYKINHAEGQFVSVHPETLLLVKEGIKYGKLSGGMFDITIGAVSELWNFRDDNPSVPEELRLKDAVKTVDYRQIEIRGNKVRLENPNAKLDLGGIAKGYIADQMAEVMEKHGAKHATVNLGGNLIAIGGKSENMPWKIGIETPYSQGSAILGSVELSDATIVTSGVYERYFEKDGKFYHHVLNPKTGYPVENSLNAVVLVGKKGQSMECDVLGTVCLALGEKKSRELLSGRDGIRAAFIDKSDQITTYNGLEIAPAE